MIAGATDVATSIIAIESVSYIFQQKLPPAEMVPARDSFSYNKETERMSKHQVWGKIVLVLLNILMEKLDSASCQWIVLYTCYLHFLIFMHFTTQITLQQSLA